MKAILLAGGVGTRLRPLTLNTPKPIVPIFGRPFLSHQIQLLKTVAEIDEIIVSLNYQPAEVRSSFGDGESSGIPIRYAVEPKPLGTGGAIRYAAQGVCGTVMVFNGDVLTNTDLRAVVDFHNSRSAKATIVLTAVENPEAYGLVETDSENNVRRFVEKPTPDQISCNTINAGIYVLETDAFARIPEKTKWSIERKYFPSLIKDRERVAAYIDNGYWIDIGTPEKYIQVHRDIMSGRCKAYPFEGIGSGSLPVVDGALVDPNAELTSPCFIGPKARIDAGAKIGKNSVIGHDVHVGPSAVVEGAILWPGCKVGANSVVRNCILGRNVQIGANAIVTQGSVIGDSSLVTDYSRIA